jgi:hypothetical protein
VANRKKLAKKTVPNLKTVLSFPPEYEDLFSKEGILSKKKSFWSNFFNLATKTKRQRYMGE